MTPSKQAMLNQSMKSCKSGGHATRCVDDSGYCSGCRANIAADAARDEAARYVRVSADGVYFGDCFISHDAILQGRGPIVRMNYMSWLLAPAGDGAEDEK